MCTRQVQAFGRKSFLFRVSYWFFSSWPTTCDYCSPGSYTNLTSSTTCQICDYGSFAPSQNSTLCKLCTTLGTYPSSISVVKGSIQCTLCSVFFPESKDGISCTLPSAPCPKGFYLPLLVKNNNTLCALCPVGTYCNDVNGTLFPSSCPFEKPFSLLPAESIDNCTSINYLMDEKWRLLC